jgi:hypothetical protein
VQILPVHMEAGLHFKEIKSVSNVVVYYAKFTDFLSYLEHREVDFGGIGPCQKLREGRAMVSSASGLAEIIRTWIFKE